MSSREEGEACGAGHRLEGRARGGDPALDFPRLGCGFHSGSRRDARLQVCADGRSPWRSVPSFGSGQGVAGVGRGTLAIPVFLWFF